MMALSNAAQLTAYYRDSLASVAPDSAAQDPILAPTWERQGRPRPERDNPIDAILGPDESSCDPPNARVVHQYYNMSFGLPAQ